MKNSLSNMPNRVLALPLSWNGQIHHHPASKMRGTGDHVRQEADQSIPAGGEIGLEEAIAPSLKTGKTSHRLSGRQDRNAWHETVKKVRYRSARRQLDNDDLMSLR